MIRVTPSARRCRKPSGSRSSTRMPARFTSSIEQMVRYVAAKASDVPAGGNKVVSVGGREIVIFHANGEFFALLNRCPHEGAPLSHAVCVAHLHSSEPGEFK